MIERQTAEKTKHWRERLEVAHDYDNSEMYHNSDEEPDLRESTSLLVVRQVPLKSHNIGRLFSNLLSLLPIVLVIIIINGIAIELRLYISHLLPFTSLNNILISHYRTVPVYNIS